jgi:hypothetical protein
MPDWAAGIQNMISEGCPRRAKSDLAEYMSNCIPALREGLALNVAVLKLALDAVNDLRERVAALEERVDTLLAVTDYLDCVDAGERSGMTNPRARETCRGLLGRSLEAARAGARPPVIR